MRTFALLHRRDLARREMRWNTPEIVDLRQVYQ